MRLMNGRDRSTAAKFAGTAEARFFARIDKPNGDEGCWLWRGSKNNKGYGKFYPAPTYHVYAHRWAYQQFVGSIPPSLQIDHLCRVRHCVNPAHLEAVTAQENMRRGNSPSCVAARTGECQRGHALPDIPNYQGKRVCETCKRNNRRAKSLASGQLQRCPRYLKQEIWERCAGSCEFCGGRISTIRQMHVHHRKLRSQGGDWSLDNLMGVHQRCHNLAPYSIHANPERSYQMGHLVRRAHDPAQVPIEIWRRPLSVVTDEGGAA